MSVPLLLLLSIVSGLGLGALLTDTDEAGLRAGVTKLAVGLLLRWVVGDLALLDDNLVVDGEKSVGRVSVSPLLGGLDLLGAGVTLLGGLGLAGEEDKALTVSLEALDVGGETLLGKVLAAGVDGDTDGGCKLAGNTSSLLMGSAYSLENCMSILHTLSSAKLKPRPARTRRLYLMEGQRTTGLSLSTGRGATAAAFAMRASLRDFFLPAYIESVSGLCCFALQAPLLSMD